MQIDTSSEGTPRREWLTDLEVARWLGIGAGTLRQHRHRGVGLPFTRLGRCVRYRRADIEQWLIERTVAAAAKGAR